MEETDREDRRASLPRAWPFANPICKPLRLIELVSVAIGFTLLFFLRNCTTEQTGQVPAEMLIWLFLNYGMLLVLTGGDVFTQLLREPTSNVPMILVCLIGCASCFSSGIGLTVVYQINTHSLSKRTLSVVGLISFTSFFTSLLFLMDMILLIRIRSLFFRN